MEGIFLEGDRGNVDPQETLTVTAGGAHRKQGVDGGAGSLDAFLPHPGRAGPRNLRMPELLDLPVAATHQISGAHRLGNHNGVSITHHHR